MRIQNALDLSIALGEDYQPTEQQQQVIEAPLTPALVVAGAGSGKTTTMADRVAWLVHQGVNPEEILGLTFTRKATQELNARIHQKLKKLRNTQRGALAQAGEFAEPTVSTYNSFANSIFRDNALMVGREPESALLDEVSAWTLARQVIIDFGKEELFEEQMLGEERSLSTLTNALLALSQEVAANQVTPEQLREYSRDFAQVVELPPKLSFPKQKEYADLTKLVHDIGGLGLLADLVERYTQLKRERNLVEYADQVALALRVVNLGEPNPVALSLRSRYRVVLLDEYQDTSVVESLLLSKIFSGSAVMAVGDPNQSIYGWRGASANNLNRFRDDFGVLPETPDYSLMTSWRNDQLILDAANLSSAPLRDSSKVKVGELTARPGAEQGTIDSFVVETDVEEAGRVAEWFHQILESHAASGLVSKPKMAILFRVRKYMALFAAALKERGIPHEIVGLGGLLSVPEVQDIICVLRVIQDPHAGSALIRLLSGGKWRIGVKDLSHLRNLAQALSRLDHEQRELPAELTDKQFESMVSESKFSIIDALDFIDAAKPKHHLLSRFSEETLHRLKNAAAFFARLRRLAGVIGIPELVQQIIEELDLDIELAANETRLGTRNLVAFRQALQGYLQSADRVGGGDLAGLIAWLDQAESNDRLSQETAPANPGAVQLLTVHTAKGLEWDYVAIPRMSMGSFPSDNKRDASGWVKFGKLPYDLRKDGEELPVYAWREQEDQYHLLKVELPRFKAELAEHQLREERRLAYVALTRAKSKLLLSASYWTEANAGAKPLGTFYQELARAGMVTEAAEISELESNPLDETLATVSWPLDPLGRRRNRVERVARTFVEHDSDAVPNAELQQEIQVLLAEAAQKKRPRRAAQLPNRIPASRFKDFIADPLGQLSEIGRPMPQKPYKQTRLGTRFHSMVEHQATRYGQQELFDAELFELDESAEDYVELQQLAQLKANFERSEWGGIQPLAVEQEIHLPLAGKIVVCKIDAVYAAAEGSGYRYQVVDWKTGKAPQTSQEHEDRLFQIHLYRLAFAELSRVPLESVDAVLYYVSTDTVIRADEIVTREDLTSRWRAGVSTVVTPSVGTGSTTSN